MLGLLSVAEEAEISRTRSLKRTSLAKFDLSKAPKSTRKSPSSRTVVHVSAAQRVQEFPGEFLVADVGAPVCTACKCDIRLM